MIGGTPLERARVRELERIADLGVLVPAARVIHATKSPLGLPPSPEVAALFQRILPDACKVLDDRLSDGRPFVAGERPTIADCTLAAGLQVRAFRWRHDRPGVRASAALGRGLPRPRARESRASPLTGKKGDRPLFQRKRGLSPFYSSGVSDSASARRLASCLSESHIDAPISVATTASENPTGIL